MKTLKSPAILGLLIAVLVGATSSAYAGTLTVQNTADSGPGSLRQAIIDAAGGDTINFDASVTGTITLSTVLAPFSRKSLHIIGPGADKLTISGNGQTGILVGVSSGQPSTISNLTFASGNGGWAAVVWHDGVTISDCIFRNNSGSSYGGAISFEGAGANVVVRCTFLNNSATHGPGGAINAHGEETYLTIEQCTFSGNSARTVGGAINVLAAGLTVTNSSFDGNQASGSGAIRFSPYNNASAVSLIQGSTFSNNRATDTSDLGYSGGAVIAKNLTLNQCTLSGNVAEGANASGGALFRYGNLAVNNCTIVGNSTPAGTGGGIETEDQYSSGTTTIYSSIIAGNTAATAPDLSGNITSQDYNLIQNTSGATITGVTAHDKYGVDPLLAPLANNGGPTQTRALLAGSPAIDGGNPAEAVSTDQRGLPRRKDGDGNGSAIADIGAFEVQSTIAVSGRISTANGIGVVGAAVTLGGLTVQSNGAGYYLFSAVPPGGYTIRPTYQNFSFTPAARTINVAASSISGQNFIGGHSISGRIYNVSGLGLSNVKVTRSGSATPVYTNSAGYYTFTTLVPGTYTITPSQTGLSFAPSSRTVDVTNSSASGQNFVASSGYTVTGRISTSSGTGIAGVSVTISSIGTTVLTNSAGYYTFNNVSNGSYTLTPSQGGFTFSPSSRTVVVSGSNVGSQNFTRTAS